MSTAQDLACKYEQLGDAAMECGSYDDAAARYVDAVALPDCTRPDFRRVLEKLLSALFLSSNPSAARPWIEIAQEYYIDHPESASRAYETFRRVFRQLWLDSRTRESRHVVTRLRELARAIRSRKLHQLASLSMAGCLILLGSYDELPKYLRDCRGLEKWADKATKSRYLETLGLAAAFEGDLNAFDKCFQRALKIADDDRNVYYTIMLLLNYTDLFIALGKISHAKASIERALDAARQNHVAWRIPQICLAYAELLALLGQDNLASAYVREALDYDLSVPIVSERLASVGIPLALRLKDPEILRRCVVPSALDRAFQSGEPGRISQVVVAFAELYVHRGQMRKAQALIHHGLAVTRRPDLSWAMLLSVARYGDPHDWNAARGLLQRRTALPHPAVSVACLSLFQAFVAARNKRWGEMRKHAAVARDRFERLKFHSYAETARSLVQGVDCTTLSAQARRIDIGTSIGSPHETLTARERQVANLVLKGLSNRAIAKALSIKERTVESHMTSIMAQLGIHSRREIQDVVA